MTPETKPTKIYLACPYSAPEFSLRELRARIASRVAAFFMSRGHVVFSPITHGHEIAEFLPPALAYDHDFWMAQCLPMLESCDVLVVVPLADWEHSRGVAAERAVVVVDLLPGRVGGTEPKHRRRSATESGQRRTIGKTKYFTAETASGMPTSIDPVGERNQRAGNHAVRAGKTDQRPCLACRPVGQPQTGRRA